MDSRKTLIGKDKRLVFVQWSQWKKEGMAFNVTGQFKQKDDDSLDSLSPFAPSDVEDD